MLILKCSLVTEEDFSIDVLVSGSVVMIILVDEVDYVS